MIVEPAWFLTQTVVLVGAGITAYIKLTERVTKLEAQVHSDLFERVINLEAIFKLLGDKAAKILHSDDDPYGIDSLLDKYLDRHYELTYQEWETLLKKCTEIEDNKELSKGERVLASWLAAVAHHKLKLPPPPSKKLE